MGSSNDQCSYIHPSHPLQRSTSYSNGERPNQSSAHRTRQKRLRRKRRSIILTHWSQSSAQVTYTSRTRLNSRLSALHTLGRLGYAERDGLKKRNRLIVTSLSLLPPEWMDGWMEVVVRADCIHPILAQLQLALHCGIESVCERERHTNFLQSSAQRMREKVEWMTHYKSSAFHSLFPCCTWTTLIQWVPDNKSATSVYVVTV